MDAITPILVPAAAEIPAFLRCKPINEGWSFEILHHLDRQGCRGVLADVASFSPLKRQAVFATLTQVNVEDPKQFLDRVGRRTLGDAFRQCRARELLEAAYDQPIPPLFLRALQRIGDHPHYERRPWKLMGAARRSYETLVRLCTEGSPEQRHALRYCGEINEKVLRNIEKLDACLLRNPALIGEVRDPELVNALVSLLRDSCSTADEGYLQQAFSTARSLFTFKKVIIRLLRGADRFPDPPVLGDGVEPLRSGREMVESGEMLSNCLAAKTPEVLLRLRYYYVCEIDDGSLPVVATLSATTDGGWLLRAVNGFGNLPLPAATIRQVVERFERLGIASEASLGALMEVRKMLDVLGVEDDPIGFDDILGIDEELAG